MVSLGGIDGNINKMSFSPVTRALAPGLHANNENEDDGIISRPVPTDDEFSENNQLITSSNPNINIIQPTPPPHTSASGLTFRPLNTIIIGVALTTTAFGVFLVSTIVPIECNTSNNDCYLGIRPLSLLLYIHCLFWGFSLICDQFIQYQHIKLRRRGYLEFYSEMRTLSQLPFWVVSTWSTLLLAITTILHDHCHNETDCGKTIRLKKSEYVTVCVGIEFAILLPVMISYLTRVWKFNRKKDQPDVLREDLMSSSGFGLEFGSQLQSVGDINEEIYERQADMIRYYKEHNSMLRKTVLLLSRQLNNERQAARGNF